MFKCSKFDDILKIYHENKLAHAFLLETNDADACYGDLLLLIKQLCCPNSFSLDCKENCNLCSLIDSNSLPSIITIEPDGSFIKKEQVISMMDRFSAKPVFSYYNIYITRKCDCFNAASANTILKFLEEPNDNIIGFFITNNKSNVISTIRSRCQEWTIHYNEITSYYSMEDIMEFKYYLNNIYRNNDDLLFNFNEASKLFEDRGEWIDFFTKLLYFFNDFCNLKASSNDIEILNNLSKKEINQVVLVIEEVLKYLKSNVNIELVLDKFVIEMRKFYE